MTRVFSVQSAETSVTLPANYEPAFASRPLIYEVISALPGGDQLMRARVIETGEEVDYPLTQIIDDPREG